MRFINVIAQSGKMIEQSELPKSGKSKTYEDYLTELHERVFAAQMELHTCQGEM
jgi:hypothetical protein